MRKKFRDKFTDPNLIKKINNLENSPQMQEKLDSIKKQMKSKTFDPIYTISSLGIFGIILAIFIFLFFGRYILIILIVGWEFFSKFLKKRKIDVGKLYANNFLLPILENILPNTKINYFEGIKYEIIKNIFSDFEKYYSNCHIIFGDDYKTEFSNLQIFHYVENSEGNNRKVYDYMGQILVSNLKTNIDGHIRIVPVVDKNLFGYKKYGIYNKKFKDEEEIETEYIDFNETYSIFSTDEFYTRLVLNPNIMEILNKWKDKMRVSVYMNEKYISISFESNENLFYLPSTKTEIDELSLAGEYEKVSEKLADFYGLIDKISEKL